MHSNTVFGELMKALPRYRFERLRESCSPGEETRRLSHWQQLTAMIYAQIAGHESLRTLVAGFNHHYAAHYHLGAGAIKRSTLSWANAHHDSAFFAEVLNSLIGIASDGGKCREAVRILDSSPIPLNPKLFGAFSKSNGRCQGAKLHLEYDANGEHPVFFQITPANVNDVEMTAALELTPGATYVFDRGYMKFAWWRTLHEAACRFVSRMQKSVIYDTVETRAVTGNTLLSDTVIAPKGSKAGKYFPYRLRLIRLRLDSQPEKSIAIVSNDLTADAETLAALYKRRWEIEVLFKWIKQHLKIKRFIGRSENAVKLQIITALIAFVLIGMYRRKSGFDGTPSQFLLLIQVDPMRKLFHQSLYERQRSYRQTDKNQLNFNFSNGYIK